MGKTASNFRATRNYSSGDLCLYGGVLYIFTSAHSAGAWTGNDAAAYDKNVESEVTRIISGTDAAKKATEYAGTVVFAPEQISGPRYKYVLTDAPDPRD